jgi:hypothetical protein
VIPQPDPTQRLSLDDEDDLLNELTEDGVADDPDDFAIGDSEITEDDTSPLPIGRRPPPPFVMKCFEAVLTYIKSVNDFKENKHFYRVLGSFWVPRRDTFFLYHLQNISPTLLYNPRFFYWDPLLLVDCICCPEKDCLGKMKRHGYSKRPRGIIDFEDRFWLVGVRYQCNTCATTYQSWDLRIMQNIPQSLAMEFPAHLSHRSGASTAVFAMMRTCFQNGMGAKQFSDIVRSPTLYKQIRSCIEAGHESISDSINVLHRRRYEMLEVQYLRMIRDRAGMTQWVDKTFLPFPPFTDRGEHGLHPIVPSARWFRDMYDKFMESHEKEFDQHQALLPCRGAAIDHSFKVCGYIFTL